MKRITAATSLQEIAVLVSEALEAAGIPAVLSGGAAVTFYSENEYISADLDFVTVERNKVIAPVLARIGFQPQGKDFHHQDSEYFVEFPPGPLSFGDRYFDSSEATVLETRYGRLRIITPTQCVMDRLAWYIHGNDLQARDQAVMVAARQCIDWKAIQLWATHEGIARGTIDGIREDVRHQIRSMGADPV